MKSAKCQQCGFVGWADVEFCKRCGAPFAPQSDAPALEAPGGYTHSHSTHAASNGELKTGIAIAALVVGFISFFTLSFLGIGAALGMTLGIVGLVKATRYPLEYGGKGFAIAGLVTSGLSVVLIIPALLVAAIAIPNVFASIRAANEGSAIQSLQKISTGESVYQATHLQYGSIDQLVDEKLVDRTLATGKHNGYRYAITLRPQLSGKPGGFEATAVPIEYNGTGIRSFCTNETGVIYAANKHGAAANSQDPALDPSWPFRQPTSDHRAYKPTEVKDNY
jgi:hypothetical protein